MGLNIPLAFYEMHEDNVKNCQTSMPSHCNLNVRSKVWCKPLCVDTSPMFLGFLVACSFLTFLLDVFSK
jgi:hypothetical protein